jgi:hypothetical protein
MASRFAHQVVKLRRRYRDSIPSEENLPAIYLVEHA